MAPKPSFTTHLYSQIAVPFIVVSVVMTILASATAVYFLRDLTQKWSIQAARTATVGVAQRYTKFGEEMRRTTDLLSDDQGLAQAADLDDAVEMHSIITNEAHLLPYRSEEIIDARDARVIVASGPHELATGTPVPGLPTWPAPVQSETVLADRGNLTVLDPVGTTGRLVLGVTTRIDDEWLAQLAKGTGGAFCFFAPDGTRVACSLRGSLSENDRALSDALTSASPDVRASLKAASTGSPAGDHVVLGPLEYRLFAVPVKTAGAVKGPIDGYILGAVSESVTEQAARDSITAIFLGLLVAVIVITGLGFWVARRVSDPLVALAAGAQRISLGDFTTKVPVRNSATEIAQLSESFNHMTDSLAVRSETLTKKVLELATLYEMSRALGSTLDMDELLGSTLDSALRIFDLDVGYVALRDRVGGALQIRAVRGGTIEDAAGTAAVRSSMAEWVVREGRPLIFNPDSASKNAHVDALTGAKAALCVPLVSAEGTIGAITVGSSNASYRFNSDDVRLLSTIGNHVTIAVGNIELFSSLQEAYIATVRSLAAAVDAKDTYTRGHSDKVATYATLIAERMGLSPDQVTALEMAAYLHDIGKIGVPEEILLKPGRLTDDEMSQMRHHPLIGANILKPVAFPWAITPIVRHHHEYWDGNGYPAGLKGEEIPLLARILCVADSYEAMTADRPYRKGRSGADAIKELDRCSGTQFDPRVVGTLTAVIEELERSGVAVIAEHGDAITPEEARAIFSAIVDGVLASFRRLGGPRLASNVETEVDQYFRSAHLPYHIAHGRLTFAEELPGDPVCELEDMRMTLRRIDAIIGRVSGGTLVDHFYEDALESLSARMRKLAVALRFREQE